MKAAKAAFKILGHAHTAVLHLAPIFGEAFARKTRTRAPNEAHILLSCPRGHDRFLEGMSMVRDYILMAVFLLAASFVVHRLLKRRWNAKHLKGGSD